MKTLKPAVAEERRQLHSFKKDYKKTDTTIKKKKCSVLWMLFIFICGLQFVFTNVLIANAETNLTVASDGVVKQSTALPLYPYSYKQDFEKEDPFKIWTSKGKYKINYQGVSQEKALSGSNSFKIDVTFEESGYLYFQIRKIEIHLLRVVVLLSFS